MTTWVLAPSRIYHDPFEQSWDGLTRGGMLCVGLMRFVRNQVRRTELVECTSICGNHTSELTTADFNVSVGVFA